MEPLPVSITFGPVPSRRLGQSLGINNIPPKLCSYSCIYCQLGRTLNMTAWPQACYDPAYIAQQVRARLEESRRRGQRVDYLSFVPSGEPCLDQNLGREIELLRPLGVPVAVITNSSLLGVPEVRRDLARADWVSIKIDALSGDVWKRINRPYRSLSLDRVLEGILEFAACFGKRLHTETMMIRGLNDSPRELEKIADFVSGLKPTKSYLSIPTRPPAERRARPPRELALAIGYDLFRQRGVDVDYLIGYEGNAFAFTGDVRQDLLSITAVHPMRRDAVKEYLVKAKAGWPEVDRLLEEKKLMEVEFGGSKYYVRRIP
jgi:wyosine [tRNA(Phe)-imidazoG37] synthetase (radical SAM superfamily)